MGSHVSLSLICNGETPLEGVTFEVGWCSFQHGEQLVNIRDINQNVETAKNDAPDTLSFTLKLRTTTLENCISDLMSQVVNSYCS